MSSRLSLHKRSYLTPFELVNLIEAIKNDDLSIENQSKLLKQVSAYTPGDRVVIFNLKIGLFAGFLNVPYIKEIGFEFFTFSECDRSSQSHFLLKELPLCCRLKESSPGIKNERMVALFIEQFVNTLSDKEKIKFKSIFFIDKFVRRFLEISSKTSKGLVQGDYFTELYSLDEETLSSYASNWIYHHEYFHRSGRLPLPDFIKYKNSKAAGSVEEIRVDSLAMLALLKNSDLEKRLTFKYILHERLFYYPSIHGPLEDYDSMSSVILFNKLKKFAGIRILGGEGLQFDEKFFSKVLVEIVKEVASLERVIAPKAPYKAREVYNSYIEKNSIEEFIEIFDSYKIDKAA